MSKYSYEQKTRWAAQAGVPLATFCGVVEVYEAETAKSHPDIRRAALAGLEEFIVLNPGHKLAPSEVAVRVGLKETEGRFVQYHTRKLLSKHQAGPQGFTANVTQN